MTLDPSTAAWLELALRAVPARSLHALLKAFATPEQVLAASARAVEAQAGPKAAADLAGRRVEPAWRERAQAWLSHPGHQLIGWDDTLYPKALLEIADPPVALFALGECALIDRPALAIVGSRNATAQGMETARSFARTLSGAGLTIVSGLALGIDGAAHQGALEGPGSTVAVVATGLDRIYPASHRALARAIAGRGALISEFPPGTPPLPGNFPRRNRLISGMSRGVLVVEASLTSGSLLTARLAAEQNRDVFAIPGSIHSPLSRGPHKLIREGAKLVETAQDVLVELGLPAAPAAPTVDELPPCPRHVQLLAAIGDAPVPIDAIVARTGLAAEAISAALVELELAGRVAAIPGGRWQRLR